MPMDETRKRYMMAGLVVGAVAVGLVVLTRRTPRDQWGETLGKVAQDALSFAKGRLGASEVLTLAEKAVERFKSLPG